jgi:hypothetical protein
LPKQQQPQLPSDHCHHKDKRESEALSAPAIVKACGTAASMAAVGEAAASLKAAVYAVYGPPGDSQARANAWLHAFLQTPAAWEACLQLLDPAERPDVTFFCANLLLSKVRSEWHKLSPNQAASMGAVIRYAVEKDRQDTELAVQGLGQRL